MALIVDSAAKVQQRILTLDRAIGDAWLVAAGLAPGEQVIVEGMQKVKPGVSVKAVPFAGGSGEANREGKKTIPLSAKSN